MYAETGLMFPYFHNFSQEIHHFDEFCCDDKPNASLDTPSSLIETSTMLDYNFGEEGDLFNAPPEPIIEEPLMSLDPMAAAISMMSCGEDVITTQSLTVSDIESSIENGQLLSEVFYECRKDLLAKDGNETPLSEVLSIHNLKSEEELLTQSSFQRSESSGCLWSMECMHDAQLRPSFLDFPVMDFGMVNGMRRAFSEGDIKTLDSANTILIQSNRSSMEQPLISSSCTSAHRMEKLSRYWNKKSKRNFGRKIKYACRKALADSQPRIRGRFAKTEEVESSKK